VCETTVSREVVLARGTGLADSTVLRALPHLVEPSQRSRNNEQVFGYEDLTPTLGPETKGARGP
jgi:hypothetical protein